MPANIIKIDNTFKYDPETAYISNANNGLLVKEFFKKLNWKVQPSGNKSHNKYHLKWVSSSNEIDYNTF